MKITEDSSVPARLMQTIGQEYTRTRAGIHVSDLTLCLRQSLYRKLKPLPPTPIEIGYFIDGASRHKVLQKLYGRGISEKDVEMEGVMGHIDIFNEIPIEFKTTRSNLAGKRISEHWVRQLVLYMLMTQSQSGILQIQLINAKSITGQNNFPSYLYSFEDSEEKHRWFIWFHSRAAAFRTALEQENPAAAPIERGDGEWVCRNCRYRTECDKIEGRQ